MASLRALRLPSPSVVIALVALLIAVGGSATAASLITSAQIRDNTIRSQDVRDHSIQLRDLSPAAVSSLRAPSGAGAGIVLANSLGPAPSCGRCEASLSVSGTSTFGSLSTANGQLSPNATIVARDLRVEIDAAPGAATRQFIIAYSPFPAGQHLTCSMTGAQTTCDSGDQTLTVPPGSSLLMDVANFGGAAPTAVRFGWRATSP
jgi:hypothetical protein